MGTRLLTKRKRPFWLPILVIGLLGADLLFFGLGPVHLLYPSCPNQIDQRAEIGAILFHDFSANDQGVSQETARRLNHGIKLFRQGKIDRLIMAGGNRPQALKTGATLMAEYAAATGLNPAKILTDYGSLDSRGNLANIEQIMDKNGWQSMLLISSPHHLNRLKRLGMLRPDHEQILTPYDPLTCTPPLTRYEIWHTVHYNLAAELLWRLLPPSWYTPVVSWIRNHTNL